MMTSRGWVLSSLTFSGEFFLESFACECSSIVRLVFCYNNSIIASHSLKIFYCLQCFIGIQMALEFNMNKSSTGINKDTASSVGFWGPPGRARWWWFDSIALECPATSSAHKVINERKLSWMSLIGRWNSSSVFDDGCHFPRHWSTGLPSKLTGWALW